MSTNLLSASVAATGGIMEERANQELLVDLKDVDRRPSPATSAAVESRGPASYSANASIEKRRTLERSAVSAGLSPARERAPTG